MKYKLIAILIILLIVFPKLNAQSKKWELTGYVSNMQSIMFADIKEDWVNDNLIHNRLNFKWYPNNYFTINIELRNRLMFGQSFETPNYANYYDSDNGYFNLTKNIFAEKSFLFNTSIDRAFVEFNKGKWNIKAGKQRINWGNNFAWNPNDIFNAYSYFDFDYPEKPGVDALRIQYYTGMASSVELATKIDKNEDITIAGLWKINKWSYDFQFLGGVFNSTDYVAGLGWTGNIESLSFRGEATYFKPIDSNSQSKEMLVAGISLDYMFKNSLMIQIEGLYSQNSSIEANNLLTFYNRDLSAKTLAFSEFSLMASTSFPFTPLLSGNITAMYFPELNGYFIGPGIEYSLANNVSLSLMSQYFNVEIAETTTEMFLGFIRVKGNF